MAKQTEEIKIKPIGNRVLAKRLEAEEKMKGGIILPDTAKKKQETAVVVAIGTGKTDKKGNLVSLPVKVGEKILMDKYGGTEVTYGDEEYVILNADDIIAVIEE